jgi:molecular chaperone GrpE
VNEREDDIPVNVKNNGAPSEGEDLIPAEPVISQDERGGEAVPAEDWHDKYMRLAAEFDNFRRRSARDFGELVRNAERDLIAELTDVLDNFGRALDIDHKGESVADFTKGMALIREQLWTALNKRGLERMETVGCPFDPSQHDAMVRMPSDEFDEGIVMQEVSPGYRLGNKILRYARVVVSQGESDSSARSTGGEESGA